MHPRRCEQAAVSRRQAQRHSRPMSRPKSGRGGTLLGIFIGLVLGLSIAAAVAYFLGRSGLTSPMSGAGAAKEPARGAKGDLGAATGAPEKPRFDFYKILPGGDEPKSDRRTAPTEKSQERAGEKPFETAKAGESARS